MFYVITLSVYEQTFKFNSQMHAAAETLEGLMGNPNFSKPDLAPSLLTQLSRA